MLVHVAMAMLVDSSIATVPMTTWGVAVMGLSLLLVEDGRKPAPPPPPSPTPLTMHLSRIGCVPTMAWCSNGG